MLRETILVFAALLVLVSATEVNKCGTGEKFEDANQVKISGCDVPVCKLKRRSEYTIEMKLVPERDINDLRNNVDAQVLGVALPFIGVDGTSACDNIYNLDGSKSGCPLKKGQEYLYRNSFPVLPIYPKLSMVVHYSLKDGNDVIACFEVPAKITG